MFENTADVDVKGRTMSEADRAAQRWVLWALAILPIMTRHMDFLCEYTRVGTLDISHLSHDS